MFVQVVNTKQELEDAFSVRRKVFVEEQKVSAEEEIDQYEDTSTHFVLYSMNTPVGAGRLRELDGYAKIERICILNDYRKGGSGRILMTGIENYAKKNGFNQFKLNAQTQAIPFYTKLGYDIVSDEFLDAGIPHQTMTKNIEADEL